MSRRSLPSFLLIFLLACGALAILVWRHYPPGLRASAVRFSLRSSPSNEIKSLKNTWPTHFVKSLYDENDDVLPDDLDATQNIVVLDFPEEGARWPASLLHEAKNKLSLSPLVRGDWYVTGMGQKLVFVPERTGARVWRADTVYRIRLGEFVYPDDWKSRAKIAPFELAFAVPGCQIRVGHTVMPSAQPPLRYQVLYRFESDHPLSADKLKRAATISLVPQVPSGLTFLPQNNKSLAEAKSDPIDAATFWRMNLKIPAGDYMSSEACNSVAIEDRVAREDLPPELNLSAAIIQLERSEGAFWPEYFLTLEFTHPVAIEDLLAHLQLETKPPRPLAFRARPHAPSFAAKHKLALESSSYDPTSVGLYFWPGPWSRTGVMAARLPAYAASVALPKLDSLCAANENAIFRFTAPGNAVLIGCGLVETDPYLVSGLNIWKTVDKKNTPAIRIMGGEGPTPEVGGLDDLATSVVCFNKAKDKIYIATLVPTEFKGISGRNPAVANPVRTTVPLPGLVCDRQKLTCASALVNLADKCDAPIHP